MKPSRRCGGVLVATGVFLVVAGAVLYTVVLPWVLKSGLQASLTVPNKMAPGYQNYYNNSGHSDATPLYEVYTMWNLTNMREVNMGTAKPAFERIGPFTYRNIETHLDADFAQDGSTVTSIWGQTYVYAGMPGELSPYDTMITNINPTYMGIIDTAGDDKDIKVTVAGAAIGRIIDFVNGPYRDALAQAHVPGKLAFALDILLANAPSTLNCTNAGKATTLPAAPLKCQRSFCAAFANSSFDQSEAEPLWFGLQALDAAAAMSTAACVRLFDATAAYSLMATDVESVDAWAGVRLGNASAAATVAAATGLSPAQLNAVVGSFLPSFQDAYIHVVLCNKYGLPAIEFLGFEQWARATVTGGVALHTLFPHNPVFMGVDEPFEFPLALGLSAGDNWMSGARAAVLLNGTLRGGIDNGLLSTNGLVDFLTAAVPPQAGVLGAKYGLDGPQTVEMLTYGLHAVTHYGDKYATELISANAGLFITKTVNDWLFDCYDPLLQVVQPPGSGCALIVNTTSLEWARANTPPDTIHTGHDNLDLLLSYIKYQEQTTIAWNDYDAPVEGTDGTQSPPFLFKPFDSSVLLNVFETDLVRPIQLAHTSTFEVHGITLHRFTPLHELFYPDQRYFQYITGFANMTLTEQAPIFFSYPNMYLADPRYIAKIDGMNPTPADEAHISVEPITGLTMDAHKRIQVNVYVDPSLSLDGYNPEFKAFDVFFALFTVDETATIIPSAAAQFRSSVYFLRDLRLALLIICSVVGAACVLGGIACCVVVARAPPPLPATSPGTLAAADARTDPSPAATPSTPLLPSPAPSASLQ